MGDLRVRFDNVLEQVEAYRPNCNADLLRRAYVFAAMAHEGQVRLSGEPYLIHPLGVAEILAEMRLDEVAIAAGFLHDLLEDAKVTEEAITEHFGPTIANLVVALTKITGMENTYAAREAAQAQTFRRMLLAAIEDPRVLLVKLADRLHNMRTLHFIKDEAKRRRIAQETMEIYAPLAHRLGIGRMKAELEDLAFAQLFPEESKNLVEMLRARQEQAQAVIEEIRRELEKMLVGNSLKGEVRFRIKHLYSVWRKLRVQRITIEQLYDFLAFRIILDTEGLDPEEAAGRCYAVLGFVNQRWALIPNRIKDFIANPKSNGYQSIHTSLMGPEGVPFEVQIRTRAMHEVAERGLAAHWLYKEGKNPQLHSEQLPWLQSLLEGQHENPQEFLDELRLNLYPEEVICFTPKGEVVRLPKGSTPLDFAYAIHTEIGHHCVGAWVNGKHVPLRTMLKTGDKVEIRTAPQQFPRWGWLEFVVTARARNKIRSYLRKLERERAKLLGRELLEREAKRWGLVEKGGIEGFSLKEAASQFGSAKEDDLLIAVGMGRVGAKEVLASLIRERQPAPVGIPGGREGAQKGKDGFVVEVRGNRDLLTFRANCCQPLPGDPIVGFITRGRGVAVHRHGCPNLRRLSAFPERQVEVSWGPPNGPYCMRLLVRFEDRQGMLAALSQAVTNTGANIRSCHLTTEDSCGVVSLAVEVNDRDQLDRIVSMLHRVRGVTQVEVRGAEKTLSKSPKG